MTMNSWPMLFPATSKQDVRARVVDHTLVATFRTSNPPTVWRMDMEKNHSFAVAIQKRANDWELGVMSPKGDFTVVARFDDREAVDQAMTEVEAAMFSNPNSTGIKVWRVSAMTAAMVVLIIIGYLTLMWLGPNNATMLPQQSTALVAPTSSAPPRAATAVATPAGATGATNGAAAPTARGVPIDADTVLGKE
jgi:hypothetical protein